MMGLSPTAALWLLPVALPISIYCAWNDTRVMKIPNVAVGAMVLGLQLQALWPSVSRKIDRRERAKRANHAADHPKQD